MSRLSDYELFFSLMLVAAANHKDASGHDAFGEHRRAFCDQCVYLRRVSSELEARQYDGREAQRPAPPEATHE